ncbi:MAG: GntR family transcriptional regulator [Spirochaetales bacterium]|nr:GntR family transcriptional regulator [Spirochaetales bacterium]
MRETAYTRLFNVLQDRILGKHYSPGQKLPTEREMCEEFNLSRITCRHAIRLLQERGLVDRFPGRGTFVKSLRPRKVPILVNDYSESIRKEAPNTTRRLMSYMEIIPPDGIAESLGLFKSEPCLLAERIDMLGDEPVAFDKAYLPRASAQYLSEDLLTRVDFLDLWLEREGIRMSHMWNSLEAVNATSEIQLKLRMPSDCPVLKVTDIVYSSANRPLAVFVTFYRGDRFRLISTNIRGGVHGEIEQSGVAPAHDR